MLLKKHKYPPEGMDDAVATVMLQCDLWADNNDMEHRVVNYSEVLKESNNQELIMVAEDRGVYDNNECGTADITKRRCCGFLAAFE